MATETEGVRRIAAERERQVSTEGWTPEHDDQHVDGSIAMAAACYAAPERIYERHTFAAGEAFVDPFPWRNDRRKRLARSGNVPPDPGRFTLEQRIDLLTKAGALIAAEIDRLLRAATRAGHPSKGEEVGRG